jgi:tripartite-type tricarboxylate transporter receptor subunit TctC
MASYLGRSADRVAISRLCVFVLLVLGVAQPCTAAAVYPARPVRLIVPFGAGGSTDVIARVFAAKLSEVLGQTVVVDNRAGAAGLIGTESAAKAPPDGYTLFVYGINQAISPALHKKLPYDPVRSFAPISLYGKLPNILVVHPSVPVKSVKEFIAYAKASPGGMRYVSSGIGASPHLTMELFKTRNEIDLIHVPYKNMGQGILDLVGGHLQAMFANLPQQIPHIRAGRVRPLAVTSAKRAEQVPEVPTVMESGLPDFEVTVWQGVAVPAATPETIVTRLHGVMMKTLAAPDLRQRLAEQGVLASPTTREEFAAYIKSETARWAKVVKDSGVTPE